MGFHDTRSIGKDLCSGIMGEGGGKAGGDPGRHTAIKRYPGCILGRNAEHDALQTCNLG